MQSVQEKWGTVSGCAGGSAALINLPPFCYMPLMRLCQGETGRDIIRPRGALDDSRRNQ